MHASDTVIFLWLERMANFISSTRHFLKCGLYLHLQTTVTQLNAL